MRERNLIVDISLTSGDTLQVEKCGKAQYQILVNGSVVKPASQPEPVIQALAELVQTYNKK